MSARSSGFVLLVSTLLSVWACLAVGQDKRGSPEPASGWLSARSPAIASKHMVSAANPYAVEAGLDVLREGGSAADAAVTVQLILNLVEPQSSGLGGGAFALYWDSASRQLKSYDGRETAPAAAKPDRFLNDGAPRSLEDAIYGGLSVGVPGVLRMLESLHQQHGHLSWSRLFAPAIKLATEGFRVSQRLHLLLSWYGPERFSPEARRYFFDVTGSARPIGYLLKNAELAETLSAIAEHGASAFYRGPIAESMVRAVREAPNHTGDLTLADLEGYRAREREPVCVAYRGQRVCGMGPPSSGAITVGQVLKLIEPFDLGSTPASAMNGKALHLMAEAEKLAFADRNRYIADPDFVPQPVGLLNTGYLQTRRALINASTAMARASPGVPPLTAMIPGADATIEHGGTSHFSIVDGQGNIVAMTTTIESGFGSRVWASGFLLNNELTDFAFRPTDQGGKPLANAVAPGKRPRSSMAPTIVFDEAGNPSAVLGSPGGSRIILYIIKTLVAVLDWKLDAQAAVSLMNFGSRGGPFEIEVDHPSAIWHALKVKPYGHHVSADFLTSGTQLIIIRKNGTLEGGADPRREGIAQGD